MPLIQFKKASGKLKLVPTKEGREEAKELLESGRGSNDALASLCEYQLGNGWSFLSPSDIGAMTDAPILSEEVFQNERGDIVLVGRVYWFPDYMVKNEVEELANGKTLVFTGEGTSPTKAVLSRYDRLREKENDGEEVNWDAFIKNTNASEVDTSKKKR